MAEDSEREKLPGELESKMLVGEGELVLHEVDHGYQVVWFSSGGKINLVGDPSEYSQDDVADAYERIKNAGDFWAEQEDFILSSDVSDVGSDPDGMPF